MNKKLSELRKPNHYDLDTTKLQLNEEFNDRGYHIINNFLNEDLSDFFYGYLMLAKKRLLEVQDNGWTNEHKMYGYMGDPQCPDTFHIYGDLSFDSILVGMKSEIEYWSGYDLTPTYSYARLYEKGASLEKHIDRPECEISITLCLGYEGSSAWPMWIKDKKGEEVECHFEKGDAILYKGHEIEHWRKTLQSGMQGQLFLHYNEKDGKFNRTYDGRFSLGLPKDANLENLMRMQFEKNKKEF
jgi:alkylated DNA repair dioxygenase AlkB